MHKRAHWWSWWLRIALAATLAASLAFVFVTEMGSRGDAHLLRLKVGELRSQAASADLVVRAGAEDKLSATFVRVQASRLADELASTIDDIAGIEPGPGVASGRERALELAARLARLLAMRGSDAKRGERAPDPMFATLTNELAALERTLPP